MSLNSCVWVNEKDTNLFWRWVLNQYIVFVMGITENVFYFNFVHFYLARENRFFFRHEHERQFLIDDVSTLEMKVDM